jgi:GNAT superfamily N-acetyltransferase
MKIRFARTDYEIENCYEVMHELRSHLSRKEFCSRVKEQMESGYRLVCLSEDEKPLSVAGFRIGLNLAWGRFLYVDDLVTLSSHQSRGYGSKLLSWLIEYAVEQGCDQFHLDSGVQRKGAHEFYQREGLGLSSYHFQKVLKSCS